MKDFGKPNLHGGISAGKFRGNSEEFKKSESERTQMRKYELTFEPNKIYRKNFALFRDFLWRKIWREN